MLVFFPRDAFDATAELLCEEFRVLDRLVNGAVVQQVATVFVDPSTHIHRLIGAAVSPARTVRGGKNRYSR